MTRTHATPLVGRELEKPLLVGTFERSAQQRSCQLVTIVGEPGVGKSRLCAELFAYIEDRPGLVRWRQGRCLPYGEGIAFWALGEIVKAECGILESDSPDEAEAKLERAAPADDPDRRLAAWRGWPRSWARRRSRPRRRSRSRPGGVSWSALAADGPTVLVFEDLHWADHGAALLPRASGRLVAGRAAAHPLHGPPGAVRGRIRAGRRACATRPRSTSPPLTDEETARLIASLLERAVLPAETQQALLERAGGNPLYAEEFVRLLADRGQLERGVGGRCRTRCRR